MTVPGLQILAQVFTERLLNTAAAGVLLASLVWILLRLVGRQNSGTRFAIWFSTLLSIVFFPFLSESVLSSSFSQVLPAGNQHGWIVLSAFWASFLFALWLLGAALLLCRLGVGLWRMRQIRRNCAEVNLASLDPAISGIFRASATRRRIKLCISNDLAVPAAIGLFRPAIVFPSWLLAQLSAEEIEMIVRHELAHLCRRDDWTNLAQKIVKAVFFFHPAVWWIENLLTIEREMACDDIVLAQTNSPKAYASSLISFAEKLHSARVLALAQALVGRMRQMSLRVAQILDANRPSHTGLWKPAVGMCAGLLMLVLGAAPYMPRVIAFKAPVQANHVEAQQTASAGLNRRTPNAIAAIPAAQTVAHMRSLVLQPRAIPAAFHPHAAAVRQVKTTAIAKAAVSPSIVQVNVVQKEQPTQAIYVLRATEFYPAGISAPPVWTLCIWKIDGKNPADRQLESAIVVSWI